ncbi:MAG: hypothetical protein P8009_09040 [Gammaproteobacteria bacterium]
MSVFYNILYSIGFTPWEEGLAQPAIAEQIAAMFDREQAGRGPPSCGCTGVMSLRCGARSWARDLTSCSTSEPCMA